MKTCFLTRLNDSVDNPNLPVLETMQQFTLDAITASGNVSMTDEQKWALNHFFYEMGAFADSNDAIWQKIKCLYIPIICSGKSTMGYDYKNSSITSKVANNSNVVEQAGALEIIETIANTLLDTTFSSITANLKNSALLVLPAANDSLGANTYIAIRTEDSNLNTDRCINHAGTPAVCSAQMISLVVGQSSVNGVRRMTSSGYDSLLANFTSDSIMCFGMDDGTISENRATVYGDYGSVDGNAVNASYKIRIYSGTKYGMLADFTTSLTASEIQKVLKAADDFRNVFL